MLEHVPGCFCFHTAQKHTDEMDIVTYVLSTGYVTYCVDIAITYSDNVYVTIMLHICIIKYNLAVSFISCMANINYVNQCLSHSLNERCSKL